MLKFSVHTEGMDAIKDKLTEGCTKAEHTVALQVRKDTSPYVPMLTGSLDKRTRVEGAEVIYPGPYARYLYFGKLMVDPATGSSYAPKGTTKVLTDKTLCLIQHHMRRHKRIGSRPARPKTLKSGSVWQIRR